MNSTTLEKLQSDVDATSAAYGRGLHDYEVGKISPAELGQLKRRMRQAEKSLQVEKVFHASR